MSSPTESSDPYLYPATTVLKNLRGLTDPREFEALEARSTHRRLAELIETPLPGGFDTAGLKAIHRCVFQDVFEWAGQFRTVDLSKAGHVFGRAAYYLGELNAAHPFREGNGRTQREFIRELGLKAGHYIDWRGTTPEEMIEASRLSHVKGDASLFAKVIRRCIGHGL